MGKQEGHDNIKLLMPGGTQACAECNYMEQEKYRTGRGEM